MVLLRLRRIGAHLTMSPGCQSPDGLTCTASDVIDKAMTKQHLDSFEGVLITMMDKRPNFTKDVAGLTRSTYGGGKDVEVKISLFTAQR